MRSVIRTLQQLLGKKKTIVNLKESIRIMKTERRDNEKNNLFEKDKRHWWNYYTKCISMKQC